MGIIKEEKNLKQILIMYLLTLIVFVFIAIVIPVMIFMQFIKFKIILPANYNEFLAKRIETKLEKLDVIKEKDIPKELRYVIIDNNLNITATDLGTEELEKVMDYIKGERKWEFNCYNCIRGKSNICVLKYDIKSTYRSEKLNYVFPKPEMLLFGIIVINILSACIISTLFFSKKLNNELVPLLNTIREIGIQNLDFKVEKTKIKEFNKILDSIIDMRDELKNTLKKRWKEERLKNQQLSALSHDIKTPLTIIKGNTQLLLESDSLEEGKEYGRFVLNGSLEIEEYLAILSNALCSGKSLKVDKNKISMKKLLDKIEQCTYSLFQTKYIAFKKNYSNIPKFIDGDETYIYRSIMNILINAFDYSKVKGKVHFNVFTENNYLYFKIIDEGKGFSREDINYAKDMFYQGDKSRTRNNHYGIGLYLTDLVAKEHGGEVILNNSNKTGGGEVIFKIKVN